ncbi:MAG: hypothetical protein OSB12_10690, partial [Planctomycetota bacterium]|nr:hypothetical protein [Planctomycetota bacterium]
LLGSLFLGESFSFCPISADGNDDGALNISDVVFLLSTLFSGGSSPSAPWPDCGPDPTPDFLRCYGYSCP